MSLRTSVLGPEIRYRPCKTSSIGGTKKRGFAVIRANGRNRQDGKHSRYDLRCDRYSSPRPSESVGIRKAASRKYGCKFRATAARTERGVGVLQCHTDPASYSHNYDSSWHASAHPQHCRISQQTRNTVANLSKHNTIRAREIRAIFFNKDPDAVYIRKDIYNVRASQ